MSKKVIVIAGPCIAAFLSSHDELIAVQCGRAEAVKTHKRGLMQQLFPAPVEAQA